jgi:thiamine biosynthesis lipoprotein
LLDRPETAEFRSHSSGAEPYLVHYSRRAMACEFEITFNAGTNSPGPALAALDLVEQLEDQMTVFREHSQVMDINRRAAAEPVQVEPRLFELLTLCVQLHRETDGAFDITSGSLTKVWGFYRRQGAMPRIEDLRAAQDRVGSDKIELDPQHRTIRFQRPGMEINLGSIGKGYALDRCAEALTAAGAQDYFCHGGRSSALGRGSRAVSNHDEAGWTVGIADPVRAGKRVGQIRLRDRALATSGSGTQFFRHKGRRYGHIIDPRTSWPAEGVLSVTVLAPTAALADGLSTAFYVLGADRAREYCRGRPELSFFMIHREPTSGRTRITAEGFSEGELRIRSQETGFRSQETASTAGNAASDS